MDNPRQGIWVGDGSYLSMSMWVSLLIKIADVSKKVAV
jgi:hypothetical protein